MRRLVFAVVAAAAAAGLAFTARAQDAPPEAAPKPLSQLEQLWWMAGTWQGEVFGSTFEEHWMRPRAGIMLGAGRMMRDGTTVFTEFLRIRQEGDQVLYTLWPGERDPVTYTLTSLTYEPERKLAHAIFTNPEHARQHTIEYLWNGEGLAGRIAGVRDGKAWEQRFKFDPSADGRKAPEAATQDGGEKR